MYINKFFLIFFFPVPFQSLSPFSLLLFTLFPPWVPWSCSILLWCIRSVRLYRSDLPLHCVVPKCPGNVHLELMYDPIVDTPAMAPKW